MFLLGAHGLLANRVPINAVNRARRRLSLLNSYLPLRQVSNRRVICVRRCGHFNAPFLPWSPVPSQSNRQEGAQGWLRGINAQSSGVKLSWVALRVLKPRRCGLFIGQNAFWDYLFVFGCRAAEKQKEGLSRLQILQTGHLPTVGYKASERHH